MGKSKYKIDLLIILEGSVCSGKTTFKHAILRLPSINNIVCVSAPYFYMCHFVCYIILKFLYLLRLKNKPIVGNYIVTFWILDRPFFCKILRILLTTETLTLPTYIMLKMVIYRFGYCSAPISIIIGDELGFTPIAEYFSYCFQCNKGSLHSIFYIFYRVLWSTLISVFELFDKSYVFFFETPLKISVHCWKKREKTDLVHIKHFIIKERILNSLLRSLLNANIYKNPDLEVIEIHGSSPQECIKKARSRIKTILKNHIRVIIRASS